MASYTALVVEDSPTMRQLLVYALKRIPGMVAVEACDGVDALKKLAANEPPDIILTDINMPIMDGLKLVKRVRSDAKMADVPIVKKCHVVPGSRTKGIFFLNNNLFHLPEYHSQVDHPLLSSEPRFVHHYATPPTSK